MPRKLRVNKAKETPLVIPADLLGPTHWAWLEGREFSDDLDSLIWMELISEIGETTTPPPPGRRPWCSAGVAARDLWEHLGKSYADEHIRQHPGSRPNNWWRFDAPEPRLRLCGIGEPSDRAGHFLEQTYCGIPIHWTLEGDVQSAAASTHPITLQPVDPKFPPLFESEPAYLDRLGLLMAAERKRLTAEDFAPVALTDILDLDLD
jgi:hypothetical protein